MESFGKSEAAADAKTIGSADVRRERGRGFLERPLGAGGCLGCYCDLPILPELISRHPVDVQQRT